jgi:hypothetical protein
MVKQTGRTQITEGTPAAAGTLAVLRNKDTKNCRNTSISWIGSSSKEVGTAGAPASSGC